VTGGASASVPPPLVVAVPVVEPDAALACVQHLVEVAPVDRRVELLLVLSHDQDAGPLALLSGDVRVVRGTGPTAGARLQQCLPLVGDVCVVGEGERPSRLDPGPRPPAGAQRAAELATSAAAWRCAARGPLPRSESPLLTAVLIVRDEQDLLPLCLDSLRGTADEVLVCDTGSVDATRELAAALGARVTQVDWTDDFSAARNAALDAATGPWALHVDADEQLVAGDPALRARLEGAGDLDGLTAVVEHLGASSTTTQVRTTVLRRDRLRWVGRVHEQLVRADGRPPVTQASDLRLVHVGHLPELVAARGKGERNLRLAALQAREDPGWRAAFEQARALHLERQRGEAAAAYRACLARLPRGERVVRVLCHRALAEIAVHADDAAAARDEAQRALALAPDDGPSRTALATALHVLGDDGAALAVLDARHHPATPGLPQQDDTSRADELRAAVATSRRLAGRDPVTVAALAARLEADQPALGLAAWRSLPGAAGALGRGRCLAALGRLDAAARHLADADWSRADALDRQLAAAVAGAAEDPAAREALARALHSYPVG
jgi:tetratricopeptide (TPR) repeat protein